MTEPVAVTITCPCPGKPHEEDTVYLRPKMDLAGGTALQALFKDKYEEAVKSKGQIRWEQITGWMTEAYLINGVTAWSLVDEAGKPLELSQQNIRSVLLDDFALSQPVGEVADGLYYDAVLAPLVNGISKSLQALLTKESTSATKRSRAKTAKPRSPSTRRSSRRPMPLKRSSTSTTPTDSTGATLVALERASTG